MPRSAKRSRKARKRTRKPRPIASSKNPTVKLDETNSLRRPRQLQSGLPGHGRPGRGSSVQGAKQNAKGGPWGANQGGAPRGASRLEPSHTKPNPNNIAAKRSHVTGKKKSPR